MSGRAESGASKRSATASVPSSASTPVAVDAKPFDAEKVEKFKRYYDSLLASYQAITMQLQSQDSLPAHLVTQLHEKRNEIKLNLQILISKFSSARQSPQLGMQMASGPSSKRPFSGNIPPEASSYAATSPSAIEAARLVASSSSTLDMPTIDAIAHVPQPASTLKSSHQFSALLEGTSGTLEATRSLPHVTIKSKTLDKLAAEVDSRLVLDDETKAVICFFLFISSFCYKSQIDFCQIYGKEPATSAGIVVLKNVILMMFAYFSIENGTLKHLKPLLWQNILKVLPKKHCILKCISNGSIRQKRLLSLGSLPRQSLLFSMQHLQKHQEKPAYNAKLCFYIVNLIHFFFMKCPPAARIV